MTNLINNSELLNFWSNKYIDCGVFRNKQVLITNNFGTYRVEIENELGFFETLFKSNNLEEVKNYYLNAFGCIYGR